MGKYPRGKETYVTWTHLITHITFKMLQCLSGMVHNVQHSIRILKQNRLIAMLQIGKADNVTGSGHIVTRDLYGQGAEDGQQDRRSGPWRKLDKVRSNFKRMSSSRN